MNTKRLLSVVLSIAICFGMTVLTFAGPACIWSTTDKTHICTNMVDEHNGSGVVDDCREAKPHMYINEVCNVCGNHEPLPKQQFYEAEPYAPVQHPLPAVTELLTAGRTTYSYRSTNTSKANAVVITKETVVPVIGPAAKKGWLLVSVNGDDMYMKATDFKK